MESENFKDGKQGMTFNEHYKSGLELPALFSL